MRLQRPVAVKVLPQARSRDRQRIGRFLQEATMTASLDHPNVIRVYDVGVTEDRAYLVTELLQGETLRARIDRGAIALGEVIRIGLDLASGLAAAHAAGLVHRDLKPENIFLTHAGATKILDFGIAKLAQDDTVRAGTSTLPGVVLGTAGYLAPEQVRGEPVDARADLFALGAVLFEMLTGVRAFERTHIVDTLHAVLHDELPGSLGDRRDVPPTLSAAITRLLQKSPGARFQSIGEVVALLGHLDSNRGGSVPAGAGPQPARALPRLPRSLAHARPITRLIGVAALVVVASAILFWWLPRLRSPSSSQVPATVLAVMPFRSIPASGDEVELGLADVLINRLSRRAELRVLPLTATERLPAASDPGDVARRLGATHVLFGRLQRESDFVRATVQLVAASTIARSGRARSTRMPQRSSQSRTLS
jgi:serine/threonine protein kinase